MNKFTISLLLICIYFQVSAQDPIFEEYDALACDSIITANFDNPNFVILDVRRPIEYNPEHIEGAIARNYFDLDFEIQLDELDKFKTYLIHCKSGARSDVAFDIMSNLGFKKVYNMIGGITAWNNESLPTTNTFMSRLMLVSDSVFHIETSTNMVDTMLITITNRANDTLVLFDLEDLPVDEFETDFVSNTKLLGAQDYTFSVYFTPLMERIDSFIINVSSNVGEQHIYIYLDQNTGIQNTNEISKIYPNPTDDKLTINLKDDQERKLEILSIEGYLVYSNTIKYQYTIDVSSYNKGIYIVKISNRTKQQVQKILIN